MDEQKNLILAIVLSALIFLGFHYFYSSTSVPAEETSPKIEETSKAEEPRPILSVKDALTLDRRLTFESDLVQGSISLDKGSLDHLILKNYHEKIDPNSDFVGVLNPYSTSDAYYIDIASDENITWSPLESPKRSDIILDGKSNRYQINRHIAFKDNYVITVEDTITNKSDKPQTIQLKGTINRITTPQTNNMMILHEGIVGVFNNKLKEITYKKFAPQTIQTQGGWCGITDKYWMSAFLLTGQDAATVQLSKVPSHNDSYRIELSYPDRVLQPNESLKQTYNLFVGAKVLETLEAVSHDLNVKNLDLAVDFGWLYFITKPLFMLLSFFKNILGNFGLAILVVTLLSKLALLPMSIKSHKSMMAMKRVQPKIDQIKKRFGDDKLKEQQEILALYRKEKVRPIGGFLPLLVQIPIFFCLYKVLYVSIEMRHAPFYGWIHDLSAPDPTSFFNLFGLLPLTPPSIFMIGLWPLLMGLTMLWQQKLTPQVNSDPTQQKMMLIMPILFTYLFASFPAGLVIYWTWSNILSVVQQLFINRYL